MSYLNPHTHNLDSADGVAKLVVDIATLGRTAAVLDEVAAERVAQDERWGEQNHRDGTDGSNRVISDGMRAKVESRAERGALTWRDILEEELWEAYAEDDPARLRAELLQVAAVAVAWIESIDRRAAATDA